MSGSIAIVAAFVIGFALISKRIGPTVISGPMIFVAAGLICGPQLLDIVDLGLDVAAIELIGEVTLAVLLFSDASRINIRELRTEYMLPARLLGIGLPLSVLLGTGLLMLLIPEVGVWEAALIAAILSPTDAALGQEVVTDPAVPARIRQGLTVESGLNDGLVVPAVALFLSLATEEDTSSAGFWATFAFQQIGVGLLVGVLVGALGAVCLNYAREQDWVDGVYAQLATFAVAIAALATSLHFGGNGFIAAFVAGIVFGNIVKDCHLLGEYTEDTAQLAAAVSFFIFGNVLLGPALDNLSLSIALCAIGTLTIGRLLPVAIALFGSKAALPTVAFVGWFGPRGLASILFGLLLLEEDLPGATDDLFAVVAWTVLLSVVLHGATAAWGAKTYGAWWADMSDDEKHSMPEGLYVTDQRPRKM